MALTPAYSGLPWKEDQVGVLLKLGLLPMCVSPGPTYQPVVKLSYPFRGKSFGCFMSFMTVSTVFKVVEATLAVGVMVRTNKLPDAEVLPEAEAMPEAEALLAAGVSPQLEAARIQVRSRAAVIR